MKGVLYAHQAREHIASTATCLCPYTIPGRDAKATVFAQAGQIGLSQVNSTKRNTDFRSSWVHRSSVCSRYSTLIPWCLAMLFRMPDKVFALIGL